MPDEALKDLADYILEQTEGHSSRFEFLQDELVLHVNANSICNVLQILRDDRECQFTILVDITAVDYPDRPERFDVVYNLLSVRQNNRIRVIIAVEEDQLVPTATDIFKTAGWLEREVWDMYGILFAGNPDMRRILTDYGFEGHPQRKDFPLTGYVELRYDEEQKRVVYEPVKLTQDFRRFDFLSPWEGMTDIQELPGDEKGQIPTGWKSFRQEVLDSQEKEKLEEQGEENIDREEEIKDAS